MMLNGGRVVGEKADFRCLMVMNPCGNALGCAVTQGTDIIGTCDMY